MNSHGLSVIASANSRLHADIILVRLRRAKINCRRISVFYPNHSMPNAVGCWLPVSRAGHLRVGGELIARAGHFAKTSVGAAHDDGREVSRLLIQSGVDTMGAHILTEKLGQGHTLLCVHATNAEEAAIAWQVFRHSRADTIVTGGDSSHSAHEVRQIAPWIAAAA